MRLFKRHEDQDIYSVTIKNPVRFQLDIDHTSVGLSFLQTSRVISQHKARTKNPKLSGLNAHIVSQYVRVLVGVNLEIVAKLLSNDHVWAFSLAGDGSSHYGTSFFDVRIRLCTTGILYNIHLVVLPFYDRHTANITNLIATLLNAIFPAWRDKLISVSTDGENTMTGRLNGVVTQLQKLATNDVIWSLAPSLCCKNSLLHVATELPSYLVRSASNRLGR